VRAADPLELSLLEHAQRLGLEARRNLADFVEQEGPAARELEMAGALADGAVSGVNSGAFRAQTGAGAPASPRFRPRRGNPHSRPGVSSCP
jgi:hypothetical protein